MRYGQLHINRTWAWIVTTIVGVLALVGLLSYLIHSDRLREYVEHQVNSKLTDYNVRIGRVYFHPIGLSIDVEDIVLMQSANPDPPIIEVGRIHASIHWAALLKGRLVGDLGIDRPRVNIDSRQFEHEDRSATPLADKGWQDALEAIYPFKLDFVEIRDGEITYIDKVPQARPIHLTNVSARANNIRNVFSPNDAYPSPIHIRAAFDNGSVRLEGNANFLQKPSMGLKAHFEVNDIDLSFFKAMASRENLAIRKGTLSTKGEFELTPTTTDVHIATLDIKHLDADYVHRAETASKEKTRLQQAKQTSEQMSDAPTVKIKVDLLTIAASKVGYVDHSSEPEMYLYVDHVEASLKDFSNQRADGSCQFTIRGKFLGSGNTRVDGSFLPESRDPHLTVNLAIEHTDMKLMSSIFEAYGKFDIKKGDFSLYSEVAVANGAVKGYVKPLFKDMEITDMRTVEQKNVFHKIYVATVSLTTKIFKNPPRQQVATQTDISGPLESPRASLWQLIVNLVRNAFITAIVPGFERELTPNGGQ